MPSDVSRTRPVAILALLAALASILCVTTPAAAETGATTRLTIDWDRLAESLRDGGTGLFAFIPQQRVVFGDAVATPLEDRWFGASPRLSLIARDWGGAQLLMGNKSIADTIRLSRSSRMMVSRMRLTGGRFSPMIQLGAGQWRTDRDILPMLPLDTEIAIQLGTGFELRIADRCALALELNHTVLYRDDHEPQQLHGPHLWSTFFGTRAVF